MRGSLETIVGAMFAGKTSELLKRILWAKHQNKKIIVIKPNTDNRYSQGKIITEGIRFINSEFADFLERVSLEGAAFFYLGEGAALIAKTFESGGFLNERALSKYALVLVKE